MDDRIRVSDADRDRVTAQLRDHFAAGRITPSELDERVSAALTAKTVGDLRAIMADLPGPAWAVRRRHPPFPFPPLILLGLLAALLIPGAGWVLLGLVNVILVFWLITFAAGAVAFGRPHRRGYSGGQPRYPLGRRYPRL